MNLLPTFSLPTFFLTLPETKKKLECRPYLVKEDKILLMAAQDGSIKEINNATRQVINNCVLNEPGFDAKNVSNNDVDYLFLHLRAKSVGEKVKQEFECMEIKDEKPCGNKFEVEFDLKDVQLIESDNKQPNDIKLFDGSIGIKLNPIPFKATLEYDPDGSIIDTNANILYHSLECVYDKDKIYTSKDFDKPTFHDWIMNMDKKSYDKLELWIENQPSLKLSKTHVCEKCGHEHKMEFDNPMDFF